jgi:hypothetical protein
MSFYEVLRFLEFMVLVAVEYGGISEWGRRLI